MASLASGVLIKLLEEMGMDENLSVSCKRVLLQIRSIIPVLTEGNLWPNHGFYMKVSDASHAVYAALPSDQNEMILSNELQLGQYIYAEKLEMAHPVPLLKGIKPLPGRYPCFGTPKELVFTDSLVKFNGSSDSRSIMEKSNGGEKKTGPKFRSQSASRSHPDGQIGRSAWDRMFKNCEANQRKNSDILKEIQKMRPSFDDKDSDSDSLETSSSSSITTRRSWNGMEIKSWNASVIKHERKPVPHHRSTCVSPIHSARSDSSDDNRSCLTRRKYICSAVKSSKSPKNRNTSVSRKTYEPNFKPPPVQCSSIDDRKRAETKVLWASLPSNLVKLGKEVMSQRDAALVAAVEALEEASAAERLIRSLSTYSEIQSAKGARLQTSIDKFLALQDDLAHTEKIVQSLTNISPLKMTDNNSKSTGSIKEVLEITFERKKQATSWIRAAIASDLSPVCIPSEIEPVIASLEATSLVKKSSTSVGSKPKDTYTVQKQRKNCEIHVGLAMQDNAVHQSWVKGSALNVAFDLTYSLQYECRSWFLAYVEKYLDGLKNKVIYLESNSQIAGMMYQFKRVNDWLDMIAIKDKKILPNVCKDSSSALDDSEEEACGRVRSKIYELLLNHVERSAMALETMQPIAQD